MRSEPTPPTTSRSAQLARRARIAALLIVLFVGATTTDLAHRVMVDHAVCDEHGELVHVAAPAALAAHRAQDLASPADEAPRARPLERDGRLHEHCQLGLFLRERAAPSAHGLAVVHLAPPAQAQAKAPPLVAPARAQPLLLLAPKQSPPV